MSVLETEWTDATDKFHFKRITPNCNHYVIYPDASFYTNNAVGMTGADISKVISIPFAHRFNKIAVCHLSAAGALSSDALTYSVTVKQGTHPFLSKYEDTLLSVVNTTASKRIDVFGTSFEYEARNYTITMNTTNTDLLIPMLYVQLVGSGGYI